MVCLPGAGFPGRLLPGQYDRPAIQVRNQVLVNRLVEGKQARLVREELADGDLLLAFLGELGPVAADALLVIEPAPDEASAKVIAAIPLVAE